MESKKVTHSRKAGKKGMSKTVKTGIAVLGFTVIFGSGVAFGATNITSVIAKYADSLLGIEKAAINGVDAEAQKKELNTYLKAAHDNIDHTIVEKGTREAVRASIEIDDEVKRIKDEVAAAEQAEIQKANEELESVANNKINEAKADLDAVVEQYFPSGQY